MIIKIYEKKDPESPNEQYFLLTPTGVIVPFYLEDNEFKFTLDKRFGFAFANNFDKLVSEITKIENKLDSGVSLHQLVTSQNYIFIFREEYESIKYTFYFFQYSEEVKELVKHTKQIINSEIEDNPLPNSAFEIRTQFEKEYEKKFERLRIKNIPSTDKQFIGNQTNLFRNS